MGTHSRPPAPCSRAPESAAVRPKLQQPQVPAPLGCHHYRRYARRSTPYAVVNVLPHASVWPSQTGLLSSGHPRPKTGLLFYFPCLASSRVAWFRLFSLSLFPLFFSRSARDSFFLRTGHLRSSDNACFSFPSPDHRPSLLSNLREIQKHFGWPAEIVPPRLKLCSSPRSTESEEAFRGSSTRYWFDIDQPRPCLLLSAPNFRLRAPELATVMAGPALATRAAPNLP